MKTGKQKIFRILDYDPLPKQEKFHSSESKYRAYIGGLGSGKTRAGCKEAIFFIIKYPGTLGVILAPTVKLLKDSTMREFFKWCPEEIIEEHNRSEQKILFKNGVEVLFRSCEDMKTIDRLRNIEIAWFWIDEAGIVPEYAWQILVGRLRQKGGPLAGWVTTTPKGKNWLFRKFVDKPEKDYFWIGSDSRENVHLPKEYIQSLETEYAGRFAQQELEGKFVSFEGMVYDAFNRMIHVIKELPKFKEIVLGLDFGFTNPTAIVIIGLDYDRRMYIIKEFYEKQVNIDQLRQAMVSFKEEYKFTRAFADPSEPQLIDDLNLKGLRIEKAIHDVIPGIAEVSARLKVQDDNKPRLYVHESCVNTIREFENYRYPEVKEEKEEKEKPLKIDDHCMDAIRYAAMGVKEDRKILVRFA